eukprot:g152.t1
MMNSDLKTSLLSSNAEDTATSPEVSPLLDRGHEKAPNILIKIIQWYWNSCVCVMLTGCIIISTSNLCFRVLNRKFSFFQIGFIQPLITIPILVPISYFKTGFIFGPKESLSKITARGILAGFGFVCGAASYRWLPMADASLLGNTHPAFVALMAWAAGTQKMDKRTTIGVIGTLMAMILVSRPPMIFGGGDGDDKMDSGRIIGISVSLAGSLIRSIGFIVIGKIDSNVPSIVIANHALFANLTISFPFLFTSFPKKLNLNISWFDALLFIGPCLCSLNQILIVRGFKIGSPVQAGVLLLTRVLLSVILGIVVLSEEITWILAIGAILLIGSIGLVTIRPRMSKDNEQVMAAVDENSECQALKHESTIVGVSK